MNERVRHRLELQARELEDIFWRNGIDAQVEGGRVGPVDTSFTVHFSQVLPVDIQEQLAAEIEESLPRARSEFLSPGEKLLVSLEDRYDSGLVELLEHKIDLSPGTIVLGWSEEDSPVLLNLEESAHIAFIGGSSAGKTAALRSCAVSLALASRQADVQMLFFDPPCDRLESGPGLGALHYLPHALAAVVGSAEDTKDVLAYLVEEVTYRRSQAIRRPTIAIFIDNLDALLQEGPEAIRQSLQQLLTHGPDSGVHLIMAFRPDAEDSNSTEHVAALLKLKAVVRIVGRVADARQSQAAALAPQLGAQNLLGRGDFLVTDEEKSVRVQTAFVDEYDLHWVLESLQRRRPPTVVARPTSSRPWIPGASSSEEPVQQFSFDGHEIRLREEAEVPGFEQ